MIKWREQAAPPPPNKAGSVPDVEPGEFAGGGLFVATLVADVIEKPVANFAQEGVQFALLTFGDELHTAIGAISDKAADIVSVGD